MSDNVVSIVPPPTINAEIIKLLEELLEQAKLGEIQGMYTVIDNGGSKWSNHTVGYSNLQMIGILEVAKLELLRTTMGS